MSIFLDQDEIDRLQQELAIVSKKKEIAQTAKEKIKKMYFDTVQVICPNNMNTLAEIGIVIDGLSAHMKSANQYYDSYYKLKYSYTKRV